MNPRRIPLLLLLLLASLAPAQDLLYFGEAPVDPAATPASTGAQDPLLQALNQVLVRVTGQAGQDLVGRLGIGLGQAQDMALARQFREAEVVDADGSVRRERRLRVEFDPRAVDALLDRSGIARWGRERPELLLWIASDAAGGVDYLVDDALVDAALERASTDYGIVLMRPILDARDRVEVTPADIRGGFTTVAVPAQMRYGADGVVMLELRRAGDFWTGRWAWRIDDDELSFQRSGANPAEVIDLGIGRIAESLAARFAVRPDRASIQRLSVGGLTRPVHYVEVRGFLEGLTGVDAVRVLGAEGDRVRFELQTVTGDLRSRIELTGPLRFERADLARGELHYRFVW